MSTCTDREDINTFTSVNPIRKQKSSDFEVKLKLKNFSEKVVGKLRNSGREYK